MKKIYYVSLIGILLSLVAISPVIAISPVATTHTNYYSSSALLHPEQGRFIRSADVFTPVKSVSSYSRFASYTRISTGTTRRFTESDNGKTVTVTKGQVVKIQLNENPSTGYRWEPSVSSGIQITDDTYAASTSGRMGAGGIHTWTMRITGTGTQHFGADYKRSWETGSADNYSIQFVVA
ncbi:MAG: protease inhibitor I42 family protein [Methanomicrobiales archaeon]